VVRMLEGVPGGIKVGTKGILYLTRKGERALMERVGGVVWVTHPQHLAVPFYQAFSPDSERTAEAADLLLGIGEVVGCGQRHKTAEAVEHALRMHEIDREPYEWYIKMRQEHPLQTSGFGIGIERYLCWLLRHGDVRDLQLLPRLNGIQVIP
jgi:asparaginyl-tRNA synthetase